jgi:L-fuconolactonase
MGDAVTDAHVHYWDPALRRYPWLAEVPAIGSAHGPAELAREAASGVPRRVVFVQADCERSAARDEVTWVESLAGRDPAVAAIIAFAPMDEGAATRQALAGLAARPLVRGVRHLIQGEVDPGFCLREAFVAGVRECGRLGLTFDLCLRHAQLPAATELVHRCPGTSFVLDHAGKPDLRTGEISAWRTDVAALAQAPNVVCKLSGLATETGTSNPDPGRLAPVVGHLLEVFGPGRLLFGSDWPVVKLATPYASWLKMAKMLLAHLSESQQALIFNDTAERIYRLG